MGRGQVRNSTAPAPPSGSGWQQFRRMLFAAWGGSPRCWGCGHPVPGPALGEIQHIISPAVRPDLAWKRSNLRPVHAGGRKRCPDCGLACNVIAAGNLCPRDELGRPAGNWTAEFIAMARQRTESKPRSVTGRDRRKPAASPRKPREPAASPGRPRTFPDAGRAW